MKRLPDILETLAGLADIFDHIAGLFWMIIYRDIGHQFKVLAHDRDGHHSRGEIAAMLRKYGVVTFHQYYDAKHCCFRCKTKQAVWADYIMRRAGVAIVGEPLSATAGPGAMPKPWAEKKPTASPKPTRQPTAKLGKTWG